MSSLLSWQRYPRILYLALGTINSEEKACAGHEPIHPKIKRSLSIKTNVPANMWTEVVTEKDGNGFPSLNEQSRNTYIYL